MAKYNITFSCGHEEERDMLGKSIDRERKVKYFEEEGLCSKCYNQKKREQLSKDHVVIQMPYGEYKERYFLYFTGEYDEETKNIEVYIPKKEYDAIKLSAIFKEEFGEKDMKANLEFCKKTIKAGSNGLNKRLKLMYLYDGHTESDDLNAMKFMISQVKELGY